MAWRTWSPPTYAQKRPSPRPRSSPCPTSPSSANPRQ
nr:MAG: hypothetical protein [Molluscum contagiosum virus]